MKTPSSGRRHSLVLLLTAMVALALPACSATSSDEDPGGSGMMGGSSGSTLRRTTCAFPDAVPGSTVPVTLVDMGMDQMMGGDAPTSSRMRLMPAVQKVAAGPVTFLVSNRGWRTHELVVLPLAAGARSGELPVASNGRVSEDGSLGEASGTCAADSGDGIRSGSAGWTTLTLPRGRYELVCNLRNHYAAGMHGVLVVS